MRNMWSREIILWLFPVLVLAQYALADISNPGCSDISELERFDCLPGKETQKENECLSRKCCWAPNGSSDIPSCFYGQHYPGYIVRNETKNAEGSKATLERQGKSGFPDDVQELAVDVEYVNENILRVKVYDSKRKRFEPPIPKRDEIKKPTDNLKYDVSISKDNAHLRVIRKETQEVLFDTGVGAFIFADQFIQLSSRLTSKYIYGLGEHNERFLLNTNWTTYTLFNRGELVPKDKPGFNMYGSHPFYLSIEGHGKTHGVFLLNSNAMDVVLQPTPAITYRVIGGILDFYFFMGPTPDDVVSQYTAIVGRPILPPYWSLGFHLSRYEYHTANKTREIWQRNRDAGIPFDTQWSDIDYMDDHKIFTVDSRRFKELRSLVDDIHKVGMHYVPITDPGLSGSEPAGTYAPYDEAKSLDILIKDHKGEILKALVWQNVTVFVDFSNPKSTAYWEAQLQRFYNEIPFDGAWIDMNEPYSFVWGSLNGCPANNTLDYPPYVPGKDVLYNGTICMSSQQFLSTHYNLHNLYSFMEGIATHKALKAIRKKRPFLLSRSTFSGYGRYGAHWTGDVTSDWSYLKKSIPNILNFNLFGIPFVGADICGFVGNTTYELCSRWSLLGAFYTFARNHNDLDTIEQDPVAFGKEMVSRVTKVLQTRYLLLPHLYTLFYKSHRDGTPVLRPIFFDNLNDTATYSIDTQFLWGKALMIIPVLEPNTTRVRAYFPKGVWYDFYTGNGTLSAGQHIILDASIDTIHLAVKGGHILPLQEPETTTTKSRNNPFRLLVALDQNSRAQGSLFWDDGDAMYNPANDSYNCISFLSTESELITTPKIKLYHEPMILGRIQLFGVKNKPTTVTANGKTGVKYSYDTKFKTLEILLDGLNITLLEENKVTWTF